jgi:hypothetical protein
MSVGACANDRATTRGAVEPNAARASSSSATPQTRGSYETRYDPSGWSGSSSRGPVGVGGGPPPAGTTTKQLSDVPVPEDPGVLSAPPPTRVPVSPAPATSASVVSPSQPLGAPPSPNDAAPAKMGDPLRVPPASAAH